MIHGDTVRFSAYTLGPEALHGLYDALHGKRVAIVSGDKGWAAAQGRLPKLDVCCHARYGRECTMAAIGTVAEACGEAGADAILGIGGGKALDVAKAAAQMIGLPVYTVPTIAATCAALTAISIVYTEGGKMEQTLFLPGPPVHTYLDTVLLAAAPARYFRAGMGDAVAKYLESSFSMRNVTVNYVNSLGAQISRSILTPLLSLGQQAYRDCEADQASDAFADAVQRVIISVGLTSLLIDQDYNGSIAHGMCYGLSILPGVEHRVLHGELVGYGCLVLLALDGQTETLAALRALWQAIGNPVSLAEMGIPSDAASLAPALAEALACPDTQFLPYPVSQERLFAAVSQVEALS